MDAARAGEAWRTLPELMDSAEASGEFTFPRRGAVVRPQKRAYGWRVNVTQLKNADGSATACFLMGQAGEEAQRDQNRDAQPASVG